MTTTPRPIPPLELEPQAIASERERLFDEIKTMSYRVSSMARQVQNPLWFLTPDNLIEFDQQSQKLTTELAELLQQTHKFVADNYEHQRNIALKAGYELDEAPQS